jgi:carbamoyltransferase
VDVKTDGTFRLDMRYCAYATGLRMTSARFHALFGGPPRKPDEPVDQRTMDLAASIQVVTDEIVLKLARALRRETGERYLPKKAREALSSAEYAATTRAKREGTREGKQFVPQPAKIAKKTARYRT